MSRENELSVRRVSRKWFSENGLSGKVGSLLAGRDPQPRISIFRAGFYATEGNSTRVTWSEVGFELKKT